MQRPRVQKGPGVGGGTARGTAWLKQREWEEMRAMRPSGNRSCEVLVDYPKDRLRNAGGNWRILNRGVASPNKSLKALFWRLALAEVPSNDIRKINLVTGVPKFSQTTTDCEEKDWTLDKWVCG